MLNKMGLGRILRQRIARIYEKFISLLDSDRCLRHDIGVHRFIHQRVMTDFGKDIRTFLDFCVALIFPLGHDLPIKNCLLL